MTIATEILIATSKTVLKELRFRTKYFFRRKRFKQRAIVRSVAEQIRFSALAETLSVKNRMVIPPPELFEMAKDCKDYRIRKSAISLLGVIELPQSAETLVEIYSDDKTMLSLRNTAYYQLIRLQESKLKLIKPVQQKIITEVHSKLTEKIRAVLIEEEQSWLKKYSTIIVAIIGSITTIVGTLLGIFLG